MNERNSVSKVKEPWWKDAVIYQIYPKSFQDSNGDGVGDLQGIISRLDYLQQLGVDAIWLCPVYKSPGIDNGYDIADYEQIDPKYGTMADMEELIAKGKKRGIRIVMDLVVNHTSDQHPWFVEARKHPDSPEHDYYVWRERPNDLKSAFSGSAWEYDEQVGQYYLHLFAKQQPDLNWTNPALRDKIYKMMNFWIAKGIGGFRMDVIELIGKQPDAGVTANGPKLHDYLQEMHRETFGEEDFLTVGETWGATLDNAPLYSDPDRKELSMVFQFEFTNLDKQAGKEKWDTRPVDPGELKQVLAKWQRLDFKHAWNSLFWDNHDLPRIVSRFGNDGKYRVESAKMLAMILHCLRGTPYIYEGEEIGMTNRHVDTIDEVADIESVRMYNERVAAGADPKQVIASINSQGRDNARTPMQWDDSQNAGFSSAKPWLAVNPNYAAINVKAALADPDSIFYVYQKLIALRHHDRILVDGDFSLLDTSAGVMAYKRILGDEQLLVVGNLTDQEQVLDLPDQIASVLVANAPVPKSLTKAVLSPYQAFVARIA
ncbi:glycoside hydrolase family 13 protein [Lactobacillus porci]|uniref:Alpha-glucosidase n=1 Tax=Lactobacillus porci TaxID=2012477 RepID=A0A6A8MDW6_9LACO|nr:alpha-glucosidase [Lactobacillus porci]MST86975.1 alpha-glucosidase [Lactobacillus porci]